jgi:hypothetical protein
MTKDAKLEQQKVIIIGDSHAKGCAAKITHILDRTFEVTGYVKPGTGLEEITNIARKETDGFTKKDMAVVWGGANNVAKNEPEKGLVDISNFVKQRKHTNIIKVSAPKRYDLSTTSCVNSEVTTYNTNFIVFTRAIFLIIHIPTNCTKFSAISWNINKYMTQNYTRG